MIRTIVRCTRLYEKLFATQTNYFICTKIHISSSVVRTGSKWNSQSDPHSAREIAKEPNAISPDLDHGLTKFIDFLHQKLNCPKEQAAELCMAHPDLLSETSDVTRNLELLLDKGVRADVILDNPKMLLTRTHDQLSNNLKIINEMNPKDINDFVPLCQLSTTKLLELKRIAKAEENIVPKGHRLYYISDAMKIEPSTVTKFISKRLFLLTLPFEAISGRLQIQLKYIDPIHILHDLWTFRCPTDVIGERLKRAKLGEKKKLMPWMARCTEEKFAKSIKYTAEEKAVAGNKPSVNYLSDRLGYDMKTTKAIMKKHPNVYDVRVTKMKEILDYLFEVGFAPVDIAQTPRIFCHSLKTTKKRLDELKSLGCRPQSLVTVCKSTNEYNKFVESWMQVRKQLKDKNIIKE